MISERGLLNFTGTTYYYKHLSGYKFTDGVKYLTDEGVAWLIDKILSTTKFNLKLQQDFVAWTLTVNEDQSATLTASDGDNHQLYSEQIDWTDFPLKSISLWFENGVLILPSEH